MPADTSREALESLARAKAKQHGLDPDLVCAMCAQESSWRPTATRYEPGFERRYLEDTMPPSQERHDRATSWGLLQVLGQVALEHGFAKDDPRADFTKLMEPEIGLEFGCRKLKACFDWAGKKGFTGDAQTLKAVLAYNGGSRPGYGTEVMRKYVALRTAKPETETPVEALGES